MTTHGPLGLFQGFGIEIEYMIVRRDTLEVLPIADRVLAAVAGAHDGEVEVGPLSWSKELARHVIELKTTEPVAALDAVHRVFQDHVGRIDALLAPYGGRLLPGGMHPTMDPVVEATLWPGDDDAVYAAFDRIFGCRGHGWSNLQAVHLNLPFADDGEFGRLHAAIRIVLPLLPALAAASPFMDGRTTGTLDNRLVVYGTNAARVPRVTGEVVPEAAFTEAAYMAEILEPLYTDMAPLDPEGVLRHEWLNARGAIARFDRQTIEIRLLDTQEAPVADLAVVAAVVAVVRALAGERLGAGRDQRRWPTGALAALLTGVVRDADLAVIDDLDYLELLGLPRRATTAGEVWRGLLEECALDEGLSPDVGGALQVILDEGPLARRLVTLAGPSPRREDLLALSRRLADCLSAGTMLRTSRSAS